MYLRLRYMHKQLIFSSWRRSIRQAWIVGVFVGVLPLGACRSQAEAQATPEAHAAPLKVRNEEKEKEKEKKDEKEKEEKKEKKEEKEKKKKIQGSLREFGGQRVLHVWGSPYEMGFAHGYLLREAIIDVVDGYALHAIPRTTFAAAATHLATVGVIDPSLRKEAEAVIEGMKAAGGAESRGLGRPLNANDLLLFNTLTDLVAIGCSSVSAWGSATAAEPELRGELALVRNLDWAADPALLRSQVIIAYEPSDPEQQALVSVAFAGYLGCLSCLNETGVGAFFNMGYGDGAATLAEAATGFSPANLLLREALSDRDINGDGRSNADDLLHTIRASRHAGSYIVHLIEPAREAIAGGRPPARIVEVEATGVDVRSADAGSKLGAEILAATNHLRARAAPQVCSRYHRIEESVEARHQMLRLEPLWTIGEAVRIDDAVVHTMIVVPATRQLKVRMRAPDLSMSSSPPRVDHRWQTLFGDRPEIDRQAPP